MSPTAANALRERSEAPASARPLACAPREPIVHLDRAVVLDEHTVFVDGWLIDPGSALEGAHVRVGPRSSEDLLRQVSRYPRADVEGSVPAARGCRGPHGFCVRALLLEADAASEPPPGQLELVISLKGGATLHQQVPLSSSASLDASARRLLAQCSPRRSSAPPRAPSSPPVALVCWLVALLMAAWRWLRMKQDHRDLLPAGDLLALDRSRERWVSAGNDPRFRLKRRLPPGFYMLEAKLALSRARVRCRLYTDAGDGESEAASLPLVLRDGRIAKRVVWLRSTARLRFDPMESPGTFTIEHLRLARIPRFFALSRMRRKLASGFSGELPAAPTREELWQKYASLFELEIEEGGLTYLDWIRGVELPSLPTREEQAAAIESWSFRPRISILTPTYNTPVALLRACADSVLAQTYPDWEWCIADDASTDPAVRRLLHELTASDPRIRAVYREQNGHIGEASNTCLSIATGDFVALLDHDDALAPNALYHVVEALQATPEAKILYSDEDKLDGAAVRCEPFFKPDWSPELLLGENYICHLGVYQRALVAAIGGFRKGFDGSQDYDLVLRCSAKVRDAREIVHIPRVLYHWRKAPGSTSGEVEHKPYTTQSAVRALEDYMTGREDASASVSVIAPGRYRHHWPVPNPAPLVSVIIPTRDGHELLRRCLGSLRERTSYAPYEILIVDNQSTCPDTLRYLADLEAEPGASVRVIRHDKPFNFAAINNHAAGEAAGSVLLLLNNDIEVISGGWLTEMVSHCVRPHIGCVGAKLYYPDDTIQHAGVVLGIGGVAGHSHKYFPRRALGYFGRLIVAQDVSAVTAAALAVRKDIYFEVGGLDERLAVAFNDVDFCLKVRAAGYKNLFTPFAELYHYESRSRGAEDTGEKQARFARECALMRERWGDLLDRDPHYSPHLSRTREDYSLHNPSEPR